MQVDCFIRNFESEACSRKCKFYSECYRESLRLMRIKREKKKVKCDK